MNEMPTIPEYLLRLSDGYFGIEAFSLETERGLSANQLSSEM